MIKFMRLYLTVGISLLLSTTACSPRPDLSQFDLEKGKAVYNNICIACHLAGMPSAAPKVGNRAAWSPRIAQGVNVLFDHALHGFNDMPAKGGHENLSDAEVHHAVAYMVSNSW